jgi:predicted nucleotidyltransferase
MIVPEMGTRRIDLSDALFTQTQQRVLGLLYGHPDESFFATEIFRRTGGGRGTVQRELERLVSSGLVLVHSVGNQRHYRANKNSPIFSELRSIVAKTSGIAEPLRAALAPLVRRINLAVVYGSVARGEAHAGSDVDLLMVASGVTLEQLFSRLARAERVVGRKINPTLLTPDEFARRRHNGNVFLTKVLSGPLIPLIGSIDGEKTAR